MLSQHQNGSKIVWRMASEAYSETSSTVIKSARGGIGGKEGKLRVISKLIFRIMSQAKLRGTNGTSSGYIYSTR